VSQGSTSEEKTLPASNRKLLKLREKGTVANAPDAIGAITLAVSLALVVLFGVGFIRGWSDLLTLAGQQINSPIETVLSTVASGSAITFMVPVALLLAITAGVAAITSSLVSGGATFSFEPMKLDFSRLNPAQGLMNMFAMARWVALGRGLIVILLMLAGAIGFGLFGIGPLVWAGYCGAGCTGPVSLIVLGGYVLYAVAILLFLAVFDIPLQHWLFRHQQRMTKTEVKQERKDQQGSPEVQQARRKLRQEASQAQRADTKKATFVLYGDGIAVGIRYVTGETNAPVIMGKLTGEAAETLIRDAKRFGMPIAYDHLLAEQSIRIGATGFPVPESMFRPIALVMFQAGAFR
jgi:type III secretion protein U